jgi:hypothetical protein
MRSERVSTANGVRYVETLEPRRRYTDRPIRRLRLAEDAQDVEQVLARLPGNERAMAEHLLREGLSRWRRWDALVRRPPPGFVPMVAEELLTSLCRSGAVQVVDRWSKSDDDWRPSNIRTEPAGAIAIGHREPTAALHDVLADLSFQDLRERAQAGPPAPMTWRAFSFVLRAAERWRELELHRSAPRPKELAAQIEHSKMWTPARQRLFGELQGRPWADLFPSRPRQLRIKGPVAHPQAALWAESVASVPLEVLPQARGIVCVENYETFEQLLAHAAGWLILQVPGGPPPAEVQLLARLHQLAPGLPVLAAFDPDPAGIRIALLVAEGAGVRLDARLMSIEALHLTRPLALSANDLRWLKQMKGRAGPFEMLRATIEREGRKGEQEALHSWLDEQLVA